VPHRRPAAGWCRRGCVAADEPGPPGRDLRLVTQQDGEGLAAYRFPNAYALMAATMALGMLGRARRRWPRWDALDADVARMGASGGRHAR